MFLGIQVQAGQRLKRSVRNNDETDDQPWAAPDANDFESTKQTAPSGGLILGDANDENDELSNGHPAALYGTRHSRDAQGVRPWKLR